LGLAFVSTFSVLGQRDKDLVILVTWPIQPIWFA